MIKFDFDYSAITDLADNLEGKINSALAKAGEELALQTHAKIVEIAQAKLHSTRNKYLENLSFQQIGPDAWMIVLDKKAVWIEDGLPAGFDMLPGLLNSPKAKVGKKGKYIVVPMEQNGRPQDTARNATDLNEAVRRELHARKIPYSDIENGPNGKPLEGLVHSFKMQTPNKTKQGPYQGHGPVGQQRQGKTGTAFLSKVQVYQKAIKTMDGQTQMKKAVMTFRVASEGSDGWKRGDALQALDAFTEAQEFALRTWEQTLASTVMTGIIEQG